MNQHLRGIERVTIHRHFVNRADKLICKTGCVRASGFRADALQRRAGSSAVGRGQHSRADYIARVRGVNAINVKPHRVLRLVAHAHQMMPLAVRRRNGSGGMIRPAGIVNDETEAMIGHIVAASVETELFAAVAIAFHNNPGVMSLRVALDPGLDGKFGVTSRRLGEIDIGNPAARLVQLAGITVRRRQKSQGSHLWPGQRETGPGVRQDHDQFTSPA